MLGIVQIISFVGKYSNILKVQSIKQQHSVMTILNYNPNTNEYEITKII